MAMHIWKGKLEKRDLIVDWVGIFFLEPLLIREENSRNKPRFHHPTSLLLTYTREREREKVSSKDFNNPMPKGLLNKTKKRQKFSRIIENGEVFILWSLMKRNRNGKRKKRKRSA